MDILKDKEYSDKEQLIVDVIAQLNEREAKMAELFSNSNYIDWLVEYMKDKTSISSDDLPYIEEINDEDRENFSKLDLFFDGIDKYADEAYEPYNTCYSGLFYNVIYNGNAFEIGVQVGQGSTVFCNKTSIDNLDKFIDINDIFKFNKARKLKRN